MNINDLLAPSPAQPDHPVSWTGAQQSDLQAPSATRPTPYNPRRTVPYPSWPPPLEHSALYANDHGSKWHDQQRQYQQHRYHVLPPVAQPFPPAQPSYNPYQPTAGYHQHYHPQPVTSPRPQLAYYPYPQPQQQQQRFYRTPSPQDPRPAKRQRSDGPNLSGLSHHALLRPQPQFEPLLFPAETTWVYHRHSQGLGHGEGSGRLNNAQLGSNKRGRGAMADRGQDDGFMGPGARAGQSGGSVRAHGSGGNFGGAASMQAEGFNLFPHSAERTAVPVATQFQGAHGFNINGNNRFTNIGMNMGNLTTVNNCGGTHGLEKLERFVSFAALHNSAEQDHTRRCHPGTRENVLRRLRDWMDNPNLLDPIFWLHGPAGAGKSAIAQTIAHAHKREEVTATFFFYRSDPNRNDGNRLFTTIAWQLAFSIPAIKDFIVHALDKMPHLPRTDVETQFEELVANPMKNIASQTPQPAPVVIIDGVDECSDEQLQQRFLTIIGNAVKSHHVPLRFLIVSRPEALIEETLHKFKDFTVSIDLAKLDDSNRDIHKYLKDKFFEIASNRGLDPAWPGQEIIQEIVFKSSGNFIFASTVIEFISDEDYDPEFLLNIIRNLTPRGNMSPFALLDELFLEILKRQRDQDFLKTFLALLIGRSSIRKGGLYKDDATLMNVSEKDLHIRLRRMRSLLKFEPFIDVYHKSFLDFLHDPTRSGQYHVSKEGGLKRYLELIVDSVVRHISKAIEHPDCHETCHSSPAFRSIVTDHEPKVVLPVKDWQEALKPLLVLQAKLLQVPMSRSCHITQVMRHLILHLAFLQGTSHPITAVQVLEPNMNKAVTDIEAQQNAPEKDLDSRLSVLLFCLQKTYSVMIVDRAIIDHAFSLLAFDYVETAARVRTLSDAQNLIDLIDSLTNNKLFLNHCGRDAACKAVRLASEIFARVPLLPQPLLSRWDWYNYPSQSFFEWKCQSAFICRILDHDSGIYERNDRPPAFAMFEDINTWLQSSPKLVTRIGVILDVARIIQYIHSMDVVLFSEKIEARSILLDSNLRAKFEFYGLFAWSVREALIGESRFLADCTYESNIYAFGLLFRMVCFEGPYRKLSNRLVEDSMQLIKRCRAKNPKSRPTMKDVVTEMETWNLTETACSD